MRYAIPPEAKGYRYVDHSHWCWKDRSKMDIQAERHSEQSNGLSLCDCHAVLPYIHNFNLSTNPDHWANQLAESGMMIR